MMSHAETVQLESKVKHVISLIHLELNSNPQTRYYTVTEREKPKSRSLKYNNTGTCANVVKFFSSFSWPVGFRLTSEYVRVPSQIAKC